ncbi:MAG: hypothetical protein H6909_02425 [Rickettsiaceae bacterium]|nr:hypothetical protein [Rickettsiaceae bacterium]
MFKSVSLELTSKSSKNNNKLSHSSNSIHNPISTSGGLNHSQIIQTSEKNIPITEQQNDTIEYVIEDYSMSYFNPSRIDLNASIFGLDTPEEENDELEIIDLTKSMCE